jgi:hypothetical protein
MEEQHSFINLTPDIATITPGEEADNVPEADDVPEGAP